MLPPGLYEQVINTALNRELSEIPDARKSVAPLDKAEASKVLAQYLADVVQKGLDNVLDNGGDISTQISLANKIVDLIQNTTQEADFATLSVDQRAEQLLALLREQDPRLAVGKTAADLIRPETSIAQSSLFTGAIHEPQMYTELKKEIVSADRIDMLVSFIKWSGLRLLMDELREFTQNGGELRIITTSYMGATDVKAIEELRALPNTRIKVSYDTKRTRLHAKTYVFYRNTGFTTAYVGSSNLSNAAISSGLEWNVKVTRRDLPETIDKIAATFESYWNSSEFEYYSEDQKERLARALKAEKYFDSNNAEVYTMDITPYSYQQEILDKLEAERTVRRYTRNLVVAATGTGKTVISALDYKRFCKQNSGKPCRLLFVAHREEILRQSLYTFRAVLKDANFGELFVGNYRPEGIDHLFYEAAEAIYFDSQIKDTEGWVESARKIFKLQGRDIEEVLQDQNKVYDKLLLVLEPTERNLELKEYLSRHFLCIDRTHNMYEVVQKDYSKGTGIRFLCDYLGKSMEDCYAFGDSENDRAMLEAVPHSIAMGNAEEAIKKSCSFVTGSVREDGIYQAMQHFGIIR